MSVNQYPGICFICGKMTQAGKGDFQSFGSLKPLQKSEVNKLMKHGKWLIRCFGCKGRGNIPNWNNQNNVRTK